VVYVLSKSVMPMARLICSLSTGAVECQLSRSKRLVLLRMEDITVRIMQDGDSGKYYGTPEEVLLSFDLSYQHVGMYRGLCFTLPDYRDTLQSGVSKVLSEAVSKSQVKQCLDQGYPVSLSLDTREKVKGVELDQMPLLLANWHSDCDAPSEVFHTWDHENDLTSDPIAAWKWGMEKKLCRCSLTLWWNMVLSNSDSHDRYMYRGETCDGRKMKCPVKGTSVWQLYLEYKWGTVEVVRAPTPTQLHIIPGYLNEKVLCVVTKERTSYHPLRKTSDGYQLLHASPYTTNGKVCMGTHEHLVSREEMRQINEYLEKLE